jgi:hypothetical protein
MHLSGAVAFDLHDKFIVVAGRSRHRRGLAVMPSVSPRRIG